MTVTDSTITQNSGRGVNIFGGTTTTINRTTISGNNGGGIGAFSELATLIVTDSTITQNVAEGSGGGVFLSKRTATTMTRTTVSGNSASSGGGGGIFVAGSLNNETTLTVTDSTIAQNVAFSHGGGIFASSQFPFDLSTLTITDSTIAQNVVTGPEGTGGGVSSQSGTISMNRTTISGNSASRGGGIASSQPVTLANTTISGNTATTNFSGGAILVGVFSLSPGQPFFVPTTTLVNVTIASNSSSQVAVGQLLVRNTIIANSTGVPGNCGAANVTDLGNNLEFPGTSCGFALASDRRADPLLRALAANGGSTQTHALGTGSPAVNAGDDGACAAAPVSGVDQRGVSRPNGAHCDIGAYESANIPFTDDSLIAGVAVIRGLHITELRARINALRVGFGLAPVIWTDPNLNLNGLPVKAVHIQEMRSAIQDVYVAASRTPPSFTDDSIVARVSVIRAIHVTELRAAVVAIE